ncbi:aldo/keto reductase [Alteromonadaceae bacterium BrNp21-10]|nr:aldo/keto reductase [Alteromonadaceae bacterium BrNp21-10]
MPRAISKRQLGQSESRVSEIGVGGAQWGNLYHPMQDHQAIDILQFLYAQGVRLFDTAPYYGFGLSEQRVGQFIQQLANNDDLFLSTKAGRLLRHVDDFQAPPVRDGFYSDLPYEVQFDYSYCGIMQSFEDSSKRLAGADIDLLLIHDIGELTHGNANTGYLQQLKSGGFKALQELKQAGDIKAFGLGVNEVEVCLDILDLTDLDCLLLAGRYTLLEQPALAQLLPRCLQQGVGVIAGGIYNSGILASGAKGVDAYYNYAQAPSAVIQRVQLLERECAEFDVSLASAAMHFVLAHPAVCAVAPGIATLSQAQQTLDNYHQPISADFWINLKNKGLIDDGAPIPNKMVTSL